MLDLYAEEHNHATQNEHGTKQLARAEILVQEERAAAQGNKYFSRLDNSALAGTDQIHSGKENAHGANGSNNSDFEGG